MDLDSRCALSHLRDWGEIVVCCRACKREERWGQQKWLELILAGKGVVPITPTNVRCRCGSVDIQLTLLTGWWERPGGGRYH